MRRFDFAIARVVRAMATASLLLAAVAHAQPGSALGRLEKESVDQALGQLGLVIDPSPAGKIVGRVYVANQDVFSPRDWYFQLLNIFHWTTRPGIIARELLLVPGQPWNPALADESVRNLDAPPPLFFSNGDRFAAPQLSSVVAVVPVTSPTPGTVDVLAVTRDLWSLRFNTEFEFQKNTLSLLRTSLSENNLFGWRKYLAARFELDQGRFGIGPTYFDPNIAGTHVTWLATATAWYARETDRYEGDDEVFSLRYPLYSLASRWGAGLDLIHQNAVARTFCDNQLCPAEVGKVVVPLAYRRRVITTDLNVVRSFGRSLIQRLTFGYRVDRRRSLLLPDFPQSPDDASLGDEFLTRWAPLSETRSEPYLRYQFFTARYGVFRDLDSFDLREDRRLGPLVALEVGAGIPALGADFVAYPMSATAGWAFAPGGTGFAVAQVQGAVRARPGDLIDQRLSAVLYFASPTIGRAGRVVVSGVTDAVRDDRSRTRFVAGGDTGLRGYQIGEFQGTVDLAAHVELRSTPLAIYSQRFGALLFYDVGHAAASYRDIVPHHDVGFGVRWLIPQLNSSVLRVDWALAMQDGPYTHAGFPGRITAGFMQSLWLLDSPTGYLPNY
jgi:hypothetical protein